MEIGPLTRDNFVIHNVNNPLVIMLMKNADRLALKMHLFGNQIVECDHKV